MTETAALLAAITWPAALAIVALAAAAVCIVLVLVRFLLWIL